MIVAMAMFEGYKEKNKTFEFHDHSKFWYKWRIYFLLPVPFMIFAILIFVIFANKETIEYYVKHNKKEEAILLMEQIIQKKAKNIDDQD